MECFYRSTIIYLLLIFRLFVTAATEHEDDKKLHIDKEHLAMDFGDLFGDWLDFGIFPDTDMDLQYFIAHDKDNNHRLDGLELLKALNHEEELVQELNKLEDAEEGHTFKEMEDTVDAILSDNDLDNDGFLNYEEFKRVSKDYSFNLPETADGKSAKNSEKTNEKKKIKEEQNRKS